MHLLAHLMGATRQVAQQAINFTGRIRGALGQRPHLIDHDGKTTPLLTGPRGFDGGIERQQVGLFGNRADRAENRLDVVAVLLQLLHRLGAMADLLAQAPDVIHRGINLLLPGVGVPLAVVGRIGGLTAGPRHFMGVGDHFMKRRGHHVHRLSLTGGDLGHLHGGFGGTAGTAVNLPRRLADALDQGADRFEKLVEQAGQLCRFILAAHGQARGQVAPPMAT